MRVQARGSGILLIAALYGALALAGFYGAALFLLRIFKQGVASLDMVEWAVSVVVFFLPFLGLYLVVILVYASLVTFDEHGVHERKLGGVSFTPWNQVKNIQFEVSYGRIVIQTDRKKVLFTPWSLDSSD